MPDVVTRVVLDVDTGIDDALAVLYAAVHPELEFAAVTCVSGNVALEQVVRNTCAVLDVAGASGVPVGSGANTTLMGGGPRTGYRHGANGLGDLYLPRSAWQPPPHGAVDLLRQRAVDHAKGPLTLVALAPQTNLAMLVRDHLDEIAGSVERLIFVGGCLWELDPSASVEFNIGHDPEAAVIVMASGLPITMYGLDVFNQLIVPEALTERLASHDHPAALLVGELLRVRHGRLMGDAGALVLMTNPELFTIQRAPIRIGLQGAERGRTLIDPAAPTVDVVTEVDADRASQRFVDVISRA